MSRVDVPKYWYNIAADLPVPLPPPRDPLDDRESRIALLTKILPSKLIDQEFTSERFVEIPERVRELYRKIGRPTPLIETSTLPKVLGRPDVKIYFKFEGALPSGSHKLNTAIAQVYYAVQDGAEEVVTETSAGQWGMATAIAASLFGIRAIIFMTRASYRTKVYRRTIMELYGAKVIESPSSLTELGRKYLSVDPDHPGSLGIAIGEAVEYVLKSQDKVRKYVPGSVMEFVLMHQTVIGLEAVQQLPEEPDYVVACVGGGSNFAGLTYPMIGAKIRGEGFKKTQFIAVEAEAAPKMTRGEYRYDHPDTAGILPLVKMYTLGKDYVPPPIHAAGLRYHGAAPSLSLLIKLGYVKPIAYSQEEVLKAGVLFARCEGIVPAPESAHAIRAVIDIVKKAPRNAVILFNLSGHGLLDAEAYMKVLGEDYFKKSTDDIARELLSMESKLTLSDEPCTAELKLR